MKKIIFIWAFGILLFFCFPLENFASSNVVQVSTDSTDYLIGDWINLKLKVSHKEKEKIVWPSVLDSLKGFELIEKKDLLIEKNDQSLSSTQHYIITVFDSGNFIIPAFRFGIKEEGKSKMIEQSSKPIELKIQTVAIDTSMAIRDIKAPLEKDLAFQDVLPYLIGFAVLCLLGWIIYYFFIRKKTKNIHFISSKEPLLPAHRAAIKALRELEEQRVWQNGNIKLYYSRLSDILREYMERRYDIMALESTTDEILYYLKNKNINGQPGIIIKDILFTSDLAKFAKKSPDPTENESCIKSAYEFINITKESDIEENLNSKTEITR